MKKILLFAFSLALMTGACKKDKKEADNLSCDELKKRMEQKGDEYDIDDKSSCTAYVDAIKAYAKAKCLSNEENMALEHVAASFSLFCE